MTSRKDFAEHPGVTPPDTAPGRYQPSDPLLAFVDSL
jgi:hypothetical protein